MATVKGPTDLDFAIEITRKFETCAGALMSVNQPFCTALVSWLYFMERLLQEQEIPEQVVSKRLPELLSTLEKLCKTNREKSKTTNSRTYHGSNTHESRSQRTGKEDFDVRQRYPELAILSKGNPQHAKDGIRRLALNYPERQKVLLQKLENFYKLMTSLTDVREYNGSTDFCVGNDLSGPIKALYHGVTSYAICEDRDKKKNIVAKLRLKFASRHDGAADPPAFDLMFCAHPHNEDDKREFNWRETRIFVDERKVRFQEGVPELESVRLPPVDNLCHTIGEDKSWQLHLLLTDHELHVIERYVGTKSWMLDAPTVSLATILRNGRHEADQKATLPRKMKYLLSYLLAKSVWQFYDTQWMSKEWKKDNIHFMFERRQDTNTGGIYLNEPFISARFDPEQDEVQRHKFPKIKALGILLLEIELGEDIERHHGPECFDDDGKVTINTDFLAAIKLFRNSDRLEDTLPLLKKVIGECLIPSKFTALRSSVEDIRKALEKHVVGPLYELNETTYGQPDSSELRPFVEFSRSHTTRKYLETALPTSSATTSHIPQRYIADAFTSTKNDLSAAWFDDLDKLNEVLSHKSERNKDPVRIAVLDTGLRDEKPYSLAIKGYKDFVMDNNAAMEDKTGHGTNSVKLIFKVFADAEIYVARVFETQNAVENTHKLMTKAIKHARDEWGVHIVSIASGFEKNYRKMEKVIKQTAAGGVIFFAAASNHGSMRSVAFPARMNEVICVFCTDGSAKISPLVNPVPQPIKARNFAILGEHVMLSPSQMVSGTSVATSIAAGLAGKLLDISRQTDSQRMIRNYEELQSIEGMSAVFDYLAKWTRDQHYNCIVPGRLLDNLREEQDMDKKRQRIWERLSEALESKYQGS